MTSEARAARMTPPPCSGPMLVRSATRRQRCLLVPPLRIDPSDEQPEHERKLAHDAKRGDHRKECDAQRWRQIRHPPNAFEHKPDADESRQESRAEDEICASAFSCSGVNAAIGSVPRRITRGANCSSPPTACIAHPISSMKTAKRATAASTMRSRSLSSSPAREVESDGDQRRGDAEAVESLIREDVVRRQRGVAAGDAGSRTRRPLPHPARTLKERREGDVNAERAFRRTPRWVLLRWRRAAADERAKEVRPVRTHPPAAGIAGIARAEH